MVKSYSKSLLEDKLPLPAPAVELTSCQPWADASSARSAGWAGTGDARTESTPGRTPQTEDAVDAQCHQGTCGVSRSRVARSAQMSQTEHLFICNIRLGLGKMSVVPWAAAMSKSYNLTCSSVRGMPYWQASKRCRPPTSHLLSWMGVTVQHIQEAEAAIMRSRAFFFFYNSTGFSPHYRQVQNSSNSWGHMQRWDHSLYNHVTNVFNDFYLFSSPKIFLCLVLLMLLHNCSWLGQSHSAQGAQKEKGRYQSLIPKRQLYPKLL